MTVAGLGVALLVASFLAPFASESPDGLEYVGRSLGFLEGGGGAAEEAAALPAPMADYSLPGLPSLPVATAIVGILGTLAVFALAAGLARGLAGRPAPVGPRIGPDAA